MLLSKKVMNLITKFCKSQIYYYFCGKTRDYILDCFSALTQNLWNNSLFYYKNKNGYKTNHRKD